MCESNLNRHSAPSLHQATPLDDLQELQRKGERELWLTALTTWSRESHFSYQGKIRTSLTRS
ncbi:MAG: hypothetical protein A2201_11270 [Alicyclobacillus sp. RIFOXYA1_FULL_53_8]|nr:MAG: hypothetical protein A2201_11270 [Alicyclobacillus sp. RIFOXYA1_FULL_53_8]